MGDPDADRVGLPSLRGRSEDSALCSLLVSAKNATSTTELALCLSEVALRVLPGVLFQVYFVDAGNRLKLVAEQSARTAESPIDKVQAGDHLARAALGRRATLVASTPSEAKDLGVWSPTYKSAIAVVLQHKASVLGVATIYSSTELSFLGGHVEWLEAASNVLALAREIERSEAESTIQSAELRRSNEELEQFAYVVSHDLQEPLRTIETFAQLLRRSNAAADPNAAKCITQVVDGAQRTGRLIRDLLAYTRVSADQPATGPKVDCEIVLKIALMNLGTAIRESDAQISHGTLPTVTADESRLAQVFTNLISNAIKYRSSAPPRVHVDATENRSEWIFSISDNGIGIHPQHHERIFSIFKRLHGREIEGTGLGLAICRKIIEGYGGRIWVESELGNGATFVFSIPR